MLMPILTVRTPVAVTQAAAVVKSVGPQQQAPIPPVRISGNQSEAVLKILETLNRHLVGSEPLPKEALIRLLDSLAKILKFPPLPQETLRDFSKRLAVFLETLPPAARLALENQLGSRNLAVSMRILAEALKTPSLVDIPRLLERLVPAPAFRPAAGQPGGKPAPAFALQPGQPIQQGRQGQPAAVQMLLTNPAVIPDPGLLQAALKKAFGPEDDDPAVAANAGETGSEQEPVTASRRDNQTPKVPVARNGDTAATAAQTRPAAGMISDTIPLLRAAVAFLAADPAALSQVAAIVAGDIDSRIKNDLEQELDLDVSAETPTPAERNPGGQPVRDIASAAATLAEAGDGTGTLAPTDTPSPDGDLPAPQADTPQAERLAAGPEMRARQMKEVDGFTGHDLGEWELEAQPDAQSSHAQDAQSQSAEPEMALPEKGLAQTLKVLAEASLPLPGEAVDAGPGALFAALAGESADMGAQALFAQLESVDAPGMLPDSDFFTGDIGDEMAAPGFEDDSWTALLDGPEEKAADRQASPHPSATEDRAREFPVLRQPENGIARDAIPFAMIPYLPAKMQETRTVEIEEEEKQAFADDDAQGEYGEDGSQPEDHDRDDTTSVQAEQATEDEPDADIAYDLYRRMGGLG